MYDPLSLRKMWKLLCIRENEATMDYYHGFALNMWKQKIFKCDNDKPFSSGGMLACSESCFNET